LGLCCAPSQLEKLVRIPLDILAEVRAGGSDLSIDAGLDLAREEDVVITLGRTAALPCDAFTNECEGAACRVARGLETEVTQQHQHVHRRVPSTVPCCAAPRSVGGLESEQSSAGALGGDPCALGGDLVR
jgi:hypothetical protein